MNAFGVPNALGTHLALHAKRPRNTFSTPNALGTR